MKYLFGHNLDIVSIINCSLPYARKLVVCDSNIHKHYKELLQSISNNILVLRAGESTKQSESLFTILDTLLNNQFTRNDCIVSVGGGVIGDIAGLAASLYMRGMEHIIVATSIIAMSDSSIGGKTAINYNNIKNIIGTFYEPKLVIADTDFLATLPHEEHKNGFGELVKVALLSGKLDLLNDTDAMIRHAAEYKMQIVANDKYDKGIRRFLNFGHTMGHAIELEYNIKHGEAVACGMDFITSFSDSISLSNNLNKKIHSILQKYKLSTMDSVDINENVLHHLIMDKKRNATNINLVMLEDIAKPKIVIKNIDEILNFARRKYAK